VQDPDVSPIVVGVVPAAGYATRLQPLEGSKEVVLVQGRPVIDYLLDRMRRVPLAELRVVTRPEKRDVIEHARRRGATVIEGYPSSVAQSLLLGMRGLDANTIVAFGFPDTLWERADAFPILVERVRAGVEIALGLFRGIEPARSDVVEVDEAGMVTRVLVKPERPPSDLIWGCFAARARALERLNRHDEPGHLLDLLARTGRVQGVRFGDEFFDVGTPDALEALAGSEPARTPR
jgi:NDP-sugar pyrophosphorylase family protein